MKVPYFLLALLLAAPAGATDDPSLDFWTGTIESKQGTLYLKRCDLGKTTYKLVELDTSSGKLLSQLDVRNLEQGQYLVAEIIAEYRYENDQNILAVDSIQTTKIGTSCHLQDIILPDA